MLRILKYPLIVLFALCTGLLVGSVNAFYAVSRFSYALILVIFVISTSIIATRLTVNKTSKSGQKTWVKLTSAFVGWCAAIAFLLITVIYFLFGGGDPYL